MYKCCNAADKAHISHLNIAVMKTKLVSVRAVSGLCVFERVRAPPALTRRHCSSVYFFFFFSPAVKSFPPTDTISRSDSSDKGSYVFFSLIYKAFTPHPPAGATHKQDAAGGY